MMERENGPIPDEYKLWMPTELDGLSWYVPSHSVGRR